MNRAKNRILIIGILGIRQISEHYKMKDLKPMHAYVEVDRAPCRSVRKKVRVTYFSVEAAIRSLLEHPMTQNSYNLVINPNDPFGKFIPNDPDELREVLNGDIYQDNYHKFVPEDPTQNFLIFPLCI
jgi:hypothetical protein